MWKFPLLRGPTWTCTTQLKIVSPRAGQIPSPHCKNYLQRAQSNYLDSNLPRFQSTECAETSLIHGASTQQPTGPKGSAERNIPEPHIKGHLTSKGPVSTPQGLRDVFRTWIWFCFAKHVAQTRNSVPAVGVHKGYDNNVHKTIFHRQNSIYYI